MLCATVAAPGARPLSIGADGNGDGIADAPASGTVPVRTAVAAGGVPEADAVSLTADPVMARAGPPALGEADTEAVAVRAAADESALPVSTEEAAVIEIRPPVAGEV